jgi:hypothetical protein
MDLPSPNRSDIPSDLLPLANQVIDCLKAEPRRWCEAGYLIWQQDQRGNWFSSTKDGFITEVAERLKEHGQNPINEQSIRGMCRVVSYMARNPIYHNGIRLPINFSVNASLNRVKKTSKKIQSLRGTKKNAQETRYTSLEILEKIDRLSPSKARELAPQVFPSTDDLSNTKLEDRLRDVKEDWAKSVNKFLKEGIKKWISRYLHNESHSVTSLKCYQYSDVNIYLGETVEEEGNKVDVRETIPVVVVLQWNLSEAETQQHRIGHRKVVLGFMATKTPEKHLKEYMKYRDLFHGFYVAVPRNYSTFERQRQSTPHGIGMILIDSKQSEQGDRMSHRLLDMSSSLRFEEMQKDKPSGVFQVLASLYHRKIIEEEPNYTLPFSPPELPRSTATR